MFDGSTYLLRIGPCNWTGRNPYIAVPEVSRMIRTGRKAGALKMLVMGAALSGAACTGSVMGGGDTGGTQDPSKPGDPSKPPTTKPTEMSKPTPEKPVDPPPPISATNSAGPAVFHRLTLPELRNTLKDLLGGDLAAGEVDLADDTGTETGFNVGATFVQSADVAKFGTAIDRLTANIGDRLTGIVPSGCNLTSTSASDNEACAKDFIEKFGMRAYRRPLNQDEKDDLTELYKGLRGEGGATFPEAITAMVRAMVQSPMFLYRWELGEPATKDQSLVRYNNFEMASRLSYFFWASMPDDKLFAAASQGKLTDPQNVANEARRLLADSRAKGGLRDFITQWLEINGMEGLQKDASYTNYNVDVAKAMIEETVAFTNSVIWEPSASGKLSDMFTSNKSFANAGLAKLYGMSNVTGDALKAVDLNANERSGILTNASFLASHADGDFSHPVKRGVTFLRHVICQPMPDPPKDLDIPTLPERQPGTTTREHFAKHETIAPICAGCHNVIDPLGFAFENYDAVGAFRTKEEGKDVDASGKLTLTSGTIEFKNAVELTKKLAETPELRDCMSRNWLRYVLRRNEVEEEKGSVNGLMKAFEEGKWDLREMLVATTVSRAFTHRKLIDGEATK
jgi:hypothetical protein